MTKRTDDGWLITAVKANERIRSVPPLNQSPWTREGFVSLKGAGTIVGDGTVPVQAGTVTTGFQLACNTDVNTGVTLGISGGPSAQANISYPRSQGYKYTTQPRTRQDRNRCSTRGLV
ncbi:MAG: MspA family porin [Gordonia sp. (in: high G+C Gram-positive bacteria)]